MKKKLYSLLLLFVFLFLGDTPARAQGWPANYNGVMLQAFYWDSFNATQWTTLEKQADELSKYFSLIWIPQSARAANTTSMGYDPLYWFSNYNSSFGTKEELVSMIKTFKGKGLGTIADIVVNHRSNVSNWVDFPRETYNGVTYQLQSTDIVSDDDGGKTKNWADQNGYSLSTNTEGTSEVYGGKCEGWDGMRDLDHASENVQTNVKAYLGMLLSDEFGYAGFRYDVAKGFPAKYFGIYNNASNPTYSVGEFWDGNPDNCKKWVNATKYNNTIQSAVFDFPFRYTVRDAINNNNWSSLSNASVMSDAAYRRYAVTFIENHDTERRANAEQDPIKKDTLAANAFLLAMPGTPCVFLTHWMAYKQEIKAMIDARKVAGITNTSTYQNMRSAAKYYANLIKVDNENRLIVVVGSDLTTYVPSNTQYTEILSGYHYKYYLANTIETAWVDKPSGEYNKGTLNVTLKAVSTDANAQLVYTLDGSNPTASSTKVSSGTTSAINEACTLKVGILKNGSVSGIIAREYTFNTWEAKTITVCVDISKVNWSSVNFWTWGGDGTHSPTNSNWPGDKVTATKSVNGKTWYYKTFTMNSADDCVNFVFSTGSGSPQTVNVENIMSDSYFEISTAKDGNNHKVNDVTNTVTGIREISAPTYNNKVYTIDGRVIRDQYDLNGLPHGIYIYKGKKVVR
ncbi:MAG: chitobiase/beta-hexosaminidase C-terminal domain-containing protein [Prevotella sp.]|nr:chitobiase/beta-hexosaminidase C-terminal domain-containing protein [Prevotella sp.]